ncbi:MAG: hypothetical protein AAFX99_09530 [Myxococcota bacterium]
MMPISTPIARSTAVVLGLVMMLLSGCGLGLYELPDPPPQEEWTAVSLVPGEDRRDSRKMYVEASAAAMDLYTSLLEKNWEGAWELLSSETRSALSFGHGGKDGKKVLSQGIYEGKPSKDFPEAKSSFRFDPVDHFVVKGLLRFEDEQPGVVESETNRRKEIYAVSRDGEVKKVVLIYEAGGWRVHKTGFSGTNLQFDL